MYSSQPPCISRYNCSQPEPLCLPGTKRDKGSAHPFPSNHGQQQNGKDEEQIWRINLVCPSISAVSPVPLSGKQREEPGSDRTTAFHPGWTDNIFPACTKLRHEKVRWQRSGLFYEKIEGEILYQMKAAGGLLISQTYTIEKSSSAEQSRPVRS